MEPQQLTDGRLRVPVSFPLPDGGVVDQYHVIGPDHPDYQRWLDWMVQYTPERLQQERR